MKKIQKFTDLEAWKAAHLFRIDILKTIREFPQVYQFGLSSQLQRSAISVGSNIAEGFGRRTLPDRLHFYVIAKASLIEAQDQIIVSYDLGLIAKDKFMDLSEKSITTHKILNGLIRSTKNLDSSSQTRGSS